MLITELVTAPTETPVTLAELRAHLKITNTDEEKYLEALLQVSTQMAEKITRRALLTQTHKLYLDELPTQTIELPFTPLQSVTHFKYYDYTTAVLTTWDSTNYFVDTKSEPGRLQRKTNYSWPTVDPRPSTIEIQFVCGYTSKDVVPNPIKQAILIMAAHAYENREPVVIGASVVEVPMTADWLLMPYRVFNAG